VAEEATGGQGKSRARLRLKIYDRTNGKTSKFAPIFRKQRVEPMPPGEISSDKFSIKYAGGEKNCSMLLRK